MKIDELKSKLQDEENLLQFYLGKGRDLSDDDIVNICLCKTKISALKKGLNACEEAPSQRNKEILEIIEKWFRDETDLMYTMEFEQRWDILKKQLTTKEEDLQ